MSAPYNSRTEARQRAWALRYKKIVNEHAVRELLTLHSGVMGTAILGVPHGSRIKGRGTIYQPSTNVGEAHYLAYSFEPKTNVVTVYDPATVSSDFTNEDLEADLARTFGTKQIKVCDMHHQVNLYHEGDEEPYWEDTWCQTWTLAWLDNTMRSWIQEDPYSKEDPTDRAMLAMRQIKRCVEEILSRMDITGIRGGRALKEAYYANGYNQEMWFRRFNED